MTLPIETRRCAELRTEPGRRIAGLVMPYGREARARMPDGRMVRERFAAFAFREYLAARLATRLNLMHDESVVIASTGTEGRGSLVLRDHPDGLDMVATLPEGDAYDAALALVADGSTAQTSVEFRALEQTLTGDRRVITAATLPGIGLVDRGAYAGGVEVRRAGRGVAGRVLYDRPRVTADRGRRRKVSVRPGAFRYALDDAEREVTLQLGNDAGQVLGSRRAGTLKLTDTDAALEFEVETLPATTYAGDFMALLEAGTIAPGVLPLYRVPPADVVPDAVSYEPDPDAAGVEIEVVHAALLTALSIRYRAPRGNPGEVERRALDPAPARRLRFWL